MSSTPLVPSTSSASPASNAWIRLRGHEPLPATAELSYIPSRTRAIRAVLVLLGCWIAAPVLFFIPPHIPWVILAAAGGVYLAVRQWRGEYLVGRFSGACPRCGAALKIEQGAKIRLPHTIDCYQCHHDPTLEVAG
jgi:hypothetical protein